ncbi:MAG: FliH/SctL family protein [Clostridium sp.]
MEKIFSKEIEEKSSETAKQELDINSIYKAIEKEAHEKGQEIINQYNEKANSIIENANTLAENLKEEASENGYQEGYKKGYSEGYDFGINEAKNEYQKIIDDAEKQRNMAYEFLEECHIESRQYLGQVEHEIINMAMEVSRKVILAEIKENKELMINIIEAAILKCADKEKIIIKLSPKNSAIVKEEKNRFSSLVDEKCNILILSDSEFDDFTYKIETPSSYVDASVDVQLEAILKSLLGEDING